MQPSPAAKVLGSVDLISQIIGLPGQSRTVARLSCVSKTICRSVKAAGEYVFLPRKLLRIFFSTGTIEGAYQLLRDHGAIFTGSGVMQFLDGKQPENLVLFVPESAFDTAVELIRANGYHRFFEVPSSAIFNAGNDSSEETEYAPFTRQVCLWHDRGGIWVLVPRHNMLYGVLHQRTTRFMNGLCADGFFSLYPAATFTAQTGLVTRGPAAVRRLRYKKPAPYTEFAMSQSGYVEGVSPFHRPFRSGRRFFGDGMCWLLPHTYLRAEPAFEKLSGNGWSLAAHRLYGQKMICTRIVASDLLRETHLASAACKAFICGILASLEGFVPPSARLDGEIPSIVRAFEAGEPVYINVGGSVHAFCM